MALIQKDGNCRKCTMKQGSSTAVQEVLVEAVRCREFSATRVIGSRLRALYEESVPRDASSFKTVTPRAGYHSNDIRRPLKLTPND
jgi:hypothetical protein